MTAKEIVAQGCGELALGWADAPKQRQSIAQALRSVSLQGVVTHVGGSLLCACARVCGSVSGHGV
jgi:hypothetical protein